MHSGTHETTLTRKIDVGTIRVYDDKTGESAGLAVCMGIEKIPSGYNRGRRMNYYGLSADEALTLAEQLLNHATYIKEKENGHHSTTHVDEGQ